MSGMRGGRTGRRGFLALLGSAALAPSAGAVGCAGLRPNEDHLRVRTDVEPLHKRFAALGELSDAHWLGYDLDAAGKRQAAPGPDARVRLVGVARTAPGTVAATLAAAPAGERFETVALAGDVPAPLAPYVPDRAGWRASTAYDLTVLARDPAQPGADGNDRADGRFLLHEADDRVWFDAVFLYA
ncbi:MULTISPECIES: hypothetical protein [Streptomyces]|uniref:hypothetical protein n=1 Tax=Streptomyces TaxID=1883 RepID=UPI00167355E5|nr:MULTISPECIES: hypothetical protein [Streptomyces]MBD3579306.1 hypothetical protein [Streptomyces sp. KD18]